MDNPRKRINNGGLEENTMAILDSSGVKEAHDIHDDRLSFLEAVRAASLVSDSPSAPSWKMYDAIFQILRGSKSLELAMASYGLLTDLDKHYPRVYLSCPDNPDTSFIGASELVVVNEAWSPFIVGTDTAHFEGDRASGNSLLLDSLRFSTLLEDIDPAVSRRNSQLLTKPVEDMLLFRYLINVLEADFLPRHTLYKGTLNWDLFRESLLTMLLGSRKLNFRSVVRECISIISKRCHQDVDIRFEDLKDSANVSGSAKIAHDSDVALAFAITELERETCISAQRFLTLIMELDVIKKDADLHGLTSRADGLRLPVLEIILDELSYNKEHISPFLEVFSDPGWKLEVVLQYFWKYCSKPSVRTRRSSESSNDATFDGVLSFFSTAASTKNIVKRITPEVAWLLLAHAFQAYISLEHCGKHVSSFAEKVGCSTQLQICNGFISAFQNIRKIDEYLEITPFEKEALFTAAIIVSQKS